MLRAQAPLEGRQGGDACYSCNSYIEHQSCTGARHCPFAVRAASALLNGFFSSDVSLAAALRDAAAVWEPLLIQSCANPASWAERRRSIGVQTTTPLASDGLAGLRDDWLSGRLGAGLCSDIAVECIDAKRDRSCTQRPRRINSKQISTLQEHGETPGPRRLHQRSAAAACKTH